MVGKGKKGGKPAAAAAPAAAKGKKEKAPLMSDDDDEAEEVRASQCVLFCEGGCSPNCSILIELSRRCML